MSPQEMRRIVLDLLNTEPLILRDAIRGMSPEQREKLTRFRERLEEYEARSGYGQDIGPSMVVKDGRVVQIGAQPGILDAHVRPGLLILTNELGARFTFNEEDSVILHRVAEIAGRVKDTDEVAPARPPLVGPISVGDKLIWEPGKPGAEEHIEVTRKQERGTERFPETWIETEGRRGKVWNSEDRLREACIRRE